MGWPCACSLDSLAELLPGGIAPGLVSGLVYGIISFGLENRPRAHRREGTGVSCNAGRHAHRETGAAPLVLGYLKYICIYIWQRSGGTLGRTNARLCCPLLAIVPTVLIIGSRPYKHTNTTVAIVETGRDRERQGEKERHRKAGNLEMASLHFSLGKQLLHPIPVTSLIYCRQRLMSRRQVQADAEPPSPAARPRLIPYPNRLYSALSAPSHQPGARPLHLLLYLPIYQPSVLLPGFPSICLFLPIMPLHHYHYSL